MKSLRWTMVAALAIAGCGRVSGVDQEPESELGAHTALNAAELVDVSTHTDDLLVGSKDITGEHIVPVHVEWAVAKDKEGCLRVKNVKLARTGGSPEVEVYKVRFKEFEEEKCVTRLDDSGEKFERIQVAYCWRWNGAVNSTECAYSGGFTLNADKVGIEGIVERPK